MGGLVHLFGMACWALPRRGELSMPAGGCLARLRRFVWLLLCELPGLVFGLQILEVVRKGGQQNFLTVFLTGY